MQIFSDFAIVFHHVSIDMNFFGTLIVTPITRYQAELASGNLQADPAQEKAIELLQKLHTELLDKQASKSRLYRIKTLFITPSSSPVKGLYFWGGVGRGKTCLMDMFYHSLPEGLATRLHFHRFMQRIHNELNSGTYKGKKNPLPAIAKTLAKESKILCFDEFFVSDIADAMILGTLLEALFEQGVILIATSNIIPNDLYRNGLQRERFMPAIKLINQNCHIFNLDNGIDYRFRTLQQAELYHFPLDKAANDNLNDYYQQLTTGQHPEKKDLEISGRNIEILGEAESILYISFKQLCQSARSQNDYIELARLFNTVLIAGLSVMTDEDNDAARRFIAMIDEFYERNVTLIISAEQAMQQIYSGSLLSFEFDRCLSRLKEMQSLQYLAQTHIP